MWHTALGQSILKVVLGIMEDGKMASEWRTEFTTLTAITVGIRENF